MREIADRGAVAQLVAHLHGMQGVRGSNPLSSTKTPEITGISGVSFLSKCRKRAKSPFILHFAAALFRASRKRFPDAQSCLRTPCLRGFPALTRSRKRALSSRRVNSLMSPFLGSTSGNLKLVGYVQTALAEDALSCAFHGPIVASDPVIEVELFRLCTQCVQLPGNLR